MSWNENIKNYLNEVIVTHKVITACKMLIKARKAVYKNKYKNYSDLLDISKEIKENENITEKIKTIFKFTNRDFKIAFHIQNVFSLFCSLISIDENLSDDLRPLISIEEHLSNDLQRKTLSLDLKENIEALENIFKLSKTYEPFQFYPRTKSYLDVFKGVLYTAIQHCCYESTKILLLLYKSKFDLKENDLSEEDKVIIANLLCEAFDAMKLDIYDVELSYRSRLTTLVLKKRSALQIIIDDFSQLITGNLDKKTKFVKSIEDSAKRLDALIDLWCDVNDSDEGLSDVEGVELLPEKHGEWWSKYGNECSRPFASRAVG